MAETPVRFRQEPHIATVKSSRTKSGPIQKGCSVGMLSKYSQFRTCFLNKKWFIIIRSISFRIFINRCCLCWSWYEYNGNAAVLLQTYDFSGAIALIKYKKINHTDIQLTSCKNDYISEFDCLSDYMPSSIFEIYDGIHFTWMSRQTLKFLVLPKS